MHVKSRSDQPFCTCLTSLWSWIFHKCCCCFHQGTPMWPRPSQNVCPLNALGAFTPEPPGRISMPEQGLTKKAFKCKSGLTPVERQIKKGDPLKHTVNHLTWQACRNTWNQSLLILLFCLVPSLKRTFTSCDFRDKGLELKRKKAILDESKI